MDQAIEKGPEVGSGFLQAENPMAPLTRAATWAAWATLCPVKLLLLVAHNEY